MIRSRRELNFCNGYVRVLYFWVQTTYLSSDNASLRSVKEEIIKILTLWKQDGCEKFQVPFYGLTTIDIRIEIMGSNDDVLVPTIKHSTYVVCVCEISLLFYYPGPSEDLKILGQKLIEGHLKETLLFLWQPKYKGHLRPPPTVCWIGVKVAVTCARQ